MVQVLLKGQNHVQVFWKLVFCMKLEENEAKVQVDWEFIVVRRSVVITVSKI